MYDFANSGYTTVVITTIYNAYFVAVIADGSIGGTGTLLWAITVGIGNAVVLLTGPVVGAIADSRAWKKRLLIATTVGCVAGTALLALAAPGEIAFAMFAVILSSVMFASGENLISAFLPEIAAPGRIGRLSGYGWGLGYLGGMMTLALCLGYVQWARSRGLSEIDYVPVTLLITAGVFAGASIPAFVWLKERATPTPGAGAFFVTGFRRVAQTLVQVRRYRDLFRFLGALVAFQAGVGTVVALAAVYAREMIGFEMQELIMLIMVVNVAAAIGAFVVGHAQDRVGFVRTLKGSLVVWVVAIMIVLVAETKTHLWIAGHVIGLAMGATQAGGRALIGRFAPLAQTAEFYGLWGLANRLASIVGPLSYGIITFLASGNQRYALVSTLVFFLAGIAVLGTVDEARGVRAVEDPSQVPQPPFRPDG
jgi:UMF1 family MFS transporter